MSSPANKLYIPLVRQPSREVLLLSQPWFLRDPNAVPATAAPRVLQFSNDTFMEDFLAGVARSGGGRDLDAFERLLTFRDYAEPPAGMLDEHGDALYPASVMRDADPANALANGEETPAVDWLRKLYLPLHCHFHLVALELQCRRAGFPRVAAQRVIEAGMVIRRLVIDREQERWQDWIPVGAGKGIWLEIADRDMRPLGQAAQAPVLDPQAIAEQLPAAAETELRARAELGADAPLPQTLQVERLNPLPAGIGDAARHTSRFGYLPLSGGSMQLPPFADPAALNASAIAALLRQRAEQGLRAEWLDQRPPTGGDAAGFVGRLRQAIQTPLRQLLNLLILPPRPSAIAVAAATAALVLPRLHGLQTRPASSNPDRSARRTLQRLLWLQADRDSSAAVWWPALASRAGTEARADRPADAGWRPDHFYAGFEADLDTLLRERIHLIADTCAPATGSPEPTANDDGEVLHLLGALLMRIRACRKTLMQQLNLQVLPADEQPDLNRKVPESEAADADDYPLVSAGSLSDEIEAWLAADSAEARASMPRPWAPLVVDPFLVSVQAQARAIEQACAEFDQAGSAGGNAYIEESNVRRQARNNLLRGRVVEALLTDPGVPRSAGDELRIIGLDLLGQPEMGLLVAPGPAPTAATVSALITGVVDRYAAASAAPSPDAQRAEASQLLNLVRPRFDADSLYAVCCYARIAGRDACEAEQLLWTPRSEVFSLAEPTDILGMKPVAMQLPDLKKLVRDIPRIAKARANPFAAVNTPPDSGISTGEDMADTARKWGIQMICSFGIPVFTICAWVLFSIILNILLLIPGFGWLLLLKFCLPVPVKK